MMLCGIQAGGAVGQSGVASLPTEFPSRGSILQGDALQGTCVSLGVSHCILSRLISCAESCPISFHAHPLNARHELLLRLSAQVPLPGAVTSAAVLG